MIADKTTCCCCLTLVWRSCDRRLERVFKPAEPPLLTNYTVTMVVTERNYQRCRVVLESNSREQNSRVEFCTQTYETEEL